MEGWGRYFCPTCRAGLEAAKNRQASHRKLERKATKLAEKKGRDVLSPQAVNQTNAPPALSVASPVDLVSSASPSVAPSQPQGCLPWLIAIGAYIAVNVWVWQENQSVGRWMLLAGPVLLLVGAAHYFAEGKTPQERGINFSINLQKIGLTMFGLWLLSQCSGGAGDGPIDSFFKK